MSKLTLKQQRFIQFYEGNATDAATKAGYSAKTARVQGGRLLLKVAIRNKIENRIHKKDGDRIMTREERQSLWSEFAQDTTKDDNVRLKAMELLGKSQADFIEKVQVSGELEVYEVFKKFDITDLVNLKSRIDTELNVTASN